MANRQSAGQHEASQKKSQTGNLGQKEAKQEKKSTSDLSHMGERSGERDEKQKRG